MLEVQVVFLTQRWREHKHTFELALAALDKDVAADENIWMGVGERQSAPWLFATVKRQRRVTVPEPWQVKTDPDGTYVYERAYEEPYLSPEAVAEDIRSILTVA